MKRTSAQSLDPVSARRKISAAKSNKHFVAAWFDRGRRGHKDAVAQWTKLHEAAFPESGPAAEGPSNGRQPVRPMRSVGRMELADSEVDDPGVQGTPERPSNRDQDTGQGPDNRPGDGRPAGPQNIGRQSGVWIVDEDSPGERGFVLVNPVTDRPVLDAEGRRETAAPESFENSVPPAVRPRHDALLEIWQIDRIPDDVATGRDSGVVYGIMLDMLGVRNMDQSQLRDLYLRIRELPERFGGDWSVVAGHLEGRLRRAIAEPFMFPALLSNEELEAHLGLSTKAETIGEAGSTAMTGTAMAPLSGQAAAGAGLLGGASGTVGEHYEGRATAYRQEIERRQDPNAWPPAPSE